MSQRLEIVALPDIPLIEPGDDIGLMVSASLKTANITLAPDDCLVIAQKIISKSEGQYRYLNSVKPSSEAIALAEKTLKDPRLVQLILDESVEIIRYRPGVIIVEHRLGYVHANAGIDQSNISSNSEDPRVLLLPEDADRSAMQLRSSLQEITGAQVNIVISDSAGRAWRNGIVGYAIGTAGFEVVTCDNGREDLFGRPLQATSSAVADELAAAASLLMGQANQCVPVVLIRGAALERSGCGSKALIREKSQDLFR